MAITWGTQNNWRWCNKCQGLWFGPNAAQSNCPQGGTHSSSGSGNYSLVDNATPTPANHQNNWRWCNKCQGMFFGGNPGSVCPADGAAHDSAGSGDYVLPQMAPDIRQDDWRWCNKCQGLFFGGNAGSVCPADHLAHDSPSAAVALRPHPRVS